MNKKDFLFEIGLEEIPSRFIVNAMDFVRQNFETGLQQHQLMYGTIELYSTPRRFSLIIYGVQEKQQDLNEEKIGPSIEVAYQNNTLTKAGQGFLKSNGCSESDVFVKETDKGKKMAVRRQVAGKLASEILMNISGQLLEHFTFQKSMRWNQENIYFARPVRWIILLWEKDILPFSWNGLQASNVTYGNRILGLDKQIIIESINNYETALEKNCVIPNREKRLKMIQKKLQNFYNELDLEFVHDDMLLATVTDIVEYPNIMEGFYDERFLSLPEKVIISTLTENQKYFAVKDKQTGKLINRFLFISNGDSEFNDTIRKGNEKVIKARLSDAEFYYQEDTKQPLEDFVPKLKDVLFEASLGNLLEKTERNLKLVGFITEKLHESTVSSDDIHDSQRAAYLAKADLVTGMLGEKEFTKLQGYMGMIYAQNNGEPEQVSLAVYEHYLPRGKDDTLPLSLPGAMVAIADKMDTVCGIIGSGRLPTGSNDPFALRRAASGIVQILFFHKLPLELDMLVKKSFSLYENKFTVLKKYYDFVLDFFKQRIIWFLQQQNIESDVIKSVMHIDFYNVVDAINRARDLQNYKQRDDFQKLVTSFKRVSNIIQQENKIEILQENLLIEETEKKLYCELQKISRKIEHLLLEKKYHELMEQLVQFSPDIDAFFDNVLVNANDNAIRLNRYALLSHIRSLFLKVADLTQIMIEDKN
jgi:glycyl-tRNA synthetase beta chain